MPGSVQNATPTLVMPWNLAIAFQHSRQYPMISNDYSNGENQRTLLAFNSKKSWRIQQKLIPALMDVFMSFYDSVGGPHKAFYFYDVFDTSPKYSYDNTGIATTGRFTVTFTKELSSVYGLPFGVVDMSIEETA